MLITLSLNIVFRLPDGYLFYFNDSQVLDKLYTSLTNSEMASAIAEFMNKINPSEFQVEEFTGYDKLGIFDAGDSYNMLIMKRMLDISAVLCIVTFILAVGIYIYYIKNDNKKILRNGFKISMGVTSVLFVVQIMVFSVTGMREAFFRLIGLKSLPDTSKLMVIMGDDFWSVISVFLAIVTIIVILLAVYIHYRFTKPPRIFY